MNEEVKIKAWVARDDNNQLYLFFNKKPDKGLAAWNNFIGDFIDLPGSYFPQTQWSDEEPTEVELTIKIKKQ